MRFDGSLQKSLYDFEGDIMFGKKTDFKIYSLLLIGLLNITIGLTEAAEDKCKECERWYAQCIQSLDPSLETDKYIALTQACSAGRESCIKTCKTGVARTRDPRTPYDSRQD
jgi:hypothetical protein